jgi:DHA1 family bicyclomycin/chloramphenicol resistance-like MFS transporter
MLCIWGLLAMLGNLASDAYLPAFNEIGRALQADAQAVQQTFTVFLFCSGVANLLHGALSDVFGRKPALFATLVLFAAASVACALARSVEILWLARAAQGATAGAGWIISRAMVKDMCSGPEAQQKLSQITMVFCFAPVIGPLLGGQALEVWGWGAIFWGLAFVAVVALLLVTLLPETVPAAGPHRKKDLALLPGNWFLVMRSKPFWRLSIAYIAVQGGLLVSVAAAPAILLGHFRLAPTEFHLQFGPMVVGIFVGSLFSALYATRVTETVRLRIGSSVMASACLADVAFALTTASASSPPLVVFLPIAAYALGMMFVLPVLTGRILDCFPDLAGTASSCQAFVQAMGFAIISGVVVAAVSDSMLLIATSKALLCVAGMLLLTGGVVRPSGMTR